MTAAFFGYLAWQCGSAFSHGSYLANVAVRRFHKELNSGAYQAIWDEAHEEFRGSGKQADFTKLLAVVHRKLGDVSSEMMTNMNVTVYPGTTYLTTQYSSTFDRGSATETFTWIKEGNSVKLYRYNIQSNALVLE